MPKTDEPVKLTIKQQRFVDFYDGNATEAALKAGYSKRSAYSQGQRLLKKDVIKRAVQGREAKKTSKMIMSREERQEFWTQVATGRIPEASMADRLRASELLGKSCADFVDRHLLKITDDLDELPDTQLEAELKKLE